MQNEMWVEAENTMEFKLLSVSFQSRIFQNEIQPRRRNLHKTETDRVPNSFFFWKIIYLNILKQYQKYSSIKQNKTVSLSSVFKLKNFLIADP